MKNITTLTVLASLIVSLYTIPALAAAADWAHLDTETVLETTLSDGSINTWTQADLVAALGLMNRKYHRDMKTESGRRAWHGNCTTTNDFDRCVKVWFYDDGFIYETPISAPKPKVEKSLEAAARRAAALAAQTNGAPGKVAQIYAKRAAAEDSAEGLAPQPVVTVEIGGAK